MEIKVTRLKFAERSTLGKLYINGDFFCYTLEDQVRTGPKVPHETAIPTGTYKVTVDFSDRFQRMMPHILDVPGFDGIRIHSGNTDKDTEGCILLGESIANDDFISSSRAAFDKFFPILRVAVESGQAVNITVSNG